MRLNYTQDGTPADMETWHRLYGHEQPMQEPTPEEKAEYRERREKLREELQGQRRIEQDTTPSIPKVMSQVRGGYARGRTGIRIF